jgi:predicted ATPase
MAMIRALKIQNYRVFKEFSLENTARVNLLVGANNSGKSSLLEAIYLLTSESPMTSLQYVLSERGEFASRSIDPRVERRGGYLVSHIFNGHTLDRDKAIVINGSSENQLSLNIYTRDVRSRENEVTQQSLFADEELEVDTHARRLIFEKLRNGGDPTRESLISSDGLISFRNYPRRVSVPDQDSRLVTTNFLPYDDLSVLWDTITLTPREDKVVEALTIVEPDVERISFTSRQSSTSGVLLKLRNQKEPIPLSSMGDGMRRILVVVASLVCVDEGTLLIDEIDTGLHFSALKDMWRLIIETSVRGNSQVFATTHSWDCVKAFQQALKESSDRNVGRLIRLERTNGHVDAIGYNSQELGIAIKQGIEFR